VVVDKQGGAHPENLLALDTRHVLAAPFGVDAKDVDGFLEGDARYDIERWAALAASEPSALTPALDPVATVDAKVDEVFASIVRSLEGGVFESSGDPERLRDVRVRTARGRFALNPEMLTLTTAAMETPPTTPGGEPWQLADLMAIDGQVNYDNVAGRVTRLKLFRVLSALRTFVYDSKLGPDEPLLRDPNALLRRLVREVKIAPADLLDPWGHSLAFVRVPGPRVPFLSLVPGYRLQSAGPDGRLGTADDVRDPFQRVLSPGTPYAKAVHEDRIVDARWDMRVGEETVDAWKQTLEELTGSSLGGGGTGEDAFGVGGLGNVGTGSGGGGLGGRRSMGIDLGPAEWLPPVRTDARGHVRLRIPLGDAETTWQVLLVAVPDQGSPAVTSVDVPVSAPLSLAVDTGTSWIVGDQVGVTIAVHNRTERPLAAALRVTASGVAVLVEPGRANRALNLPPRSATPVVVYIRAPAVGSGILEATVTAPGVPSDAAHHEWQVKPAGETLSASEAAWIDRDATLSGPASDAGAVAVGPGRLVLERGLAPTLAAALESLRPERLTGLGAIADALEICARVRSWAIVRGGQTDPLAVRARELAALAVGRESAYEGKGHARAAERDRPLLMRARLWQDAGPPSRSPSASMSPRVDCPPASVSDLASRLDWLEVTPRASQGADRSCWVAFQASALQQLAATGDPLLLARALLAVADRPASAIVAGALADRLRATAPVGADGTMVLSPAHARERAARSTIMAALVRARRLGSVDRVATANAAKLWTRLFVERDPDGGYGSVHATRAVVRTLLESEGGETQPPPATITVRWNELGTDGHAGSEHRTLLSATGSQTVSFPLGSATAGARVETSAPGVIARLERSMFRSFLRPPNPAASPLFLQIEAPPDCRARGTASLQVSLKHALGRSAPVVTRIPLPPGAALAERVDGVRQIQGALYVRTTLDSDPLPRVFVIPLRFALPGTITFPEATARIDDDDLPPARAPARPLVIQPW
jgi:hypothetical protein